MGEGEGQSQHREVMKYPVRGVIPPVGDEETGLIAGNQIIWGFQLRKEEHKMMKKGIILVCIFVFLGAGIALAAAPKKGEKPAAAEEGGHGGAEKGRNARLRAGRRQRRSGPGL